MTPVRPVIAIQHVVRVFRPFGNGTQEGGAGSANGITIAALVLLAFVGASACHLEEGGHRINTRHHPLKLNENPCIELHSMTSACVGNIASVSICQTESGLRWRRNTRERIGWAFFGLL